MAVVPGLLRSWGLCQGSNYLSAQLSVQPVPLYTVGTQAGRPQESLKLRVFDVAFLFLPFWSWVLYSYTNLPATYFHLQKHQHLLRIIEQVT